MHHNLSNGAQIAAGVANTGAGTTAVNGATVDMQNYEGVLFVCKFGTAAANNTIKGQQGQASDLSDAADLAGTSVAVGSSDEIVWLDLYRPRERYVRMVAVRGTSTTVEWGVAIRYGPRKAPVDNNVAGTIAGELHVSPAEGTA